MAVQEHTGRLRVWTLHERYELSGPLLDTESTAYVAQDCTWGGAELLYVETRRPPPELADFGRDSDVVSFWPHDYVGEHSRLLAWDPISGAVRAIKPGAYTAVVADSAGRRVMAFDPIAALDHQDGLVNRALLLDGTTGATQAESRFGGGGWGGGSAVRADPPWPLVWHPTLDVLFMVNGPGIASSRRNPMPANTLVALTPQGPLESLTNQGSLRLVQSFGVWTVPLPVPIHGGAELAALVEDDLGGRCSLGVFGPEGLRHSFPFSARWRCPVGMKDLGENWNFICPGLDGHSAVFQSATPTTGNDHGTELYDVWLWNLDADTGMLLCRIAPIERCFGWIHDHALMIGVQAQDEDGKWAGADYGVIYWNSDSG